MKHFVRTAAAAATLSASSLMGSAAMVEAYQVDCAILLCLAGGWPASAPCSHARAEFIRRITPWPIEPPLQIWRCPMGVSLRGPASFSAIERLYDIKFRAGPDGRAQGIDMPAWGLTQAGEQADIDISGKAFDFVRSLRVFSIEYRQQRDRDGDCHISDATRLGSYGVQGDYRWARSSAGQVPSASALRLSEHCRNYSYRSVFVDWRDHTGAYGSEEVRY